MKVLSSEKIPIKMWAEEIEEGAIAQLKNLANLPFAFSHIAVMPDCHQGYGMPIGGVLATKGAIVPNAVGVDIGCGMCAVRTSLKEITQEKLKIIMRKIREEIPVGFNHQTIAQDINLMPKLYMRTIVQLEYENALKQLGTLGGGNHFIEIQKGSDGFIWVMIHSGSRNLGKKVADYYNAKAVELNEKYFSSVPKNYELAFLPIDTNTAQDYIDEMRYCVEFALANRLLMMNKIIEILSVDCDAPINIAHNYATMEHHFGSEVWIHRKGATLAREGTIGIIPGSQGTKSYIVKGKGNKESFDSCSHGAGRIMGRKEACRKLNLEDEIKKLDNQGIIHGIRNAEDLDEAAGAYKDISIVMENQKDLVDILVELTPLAVIKG